MTDRPMQRRLFARLAAGLATLSVAGCFHEGEGDPAAPTDDDGPGGNESDDGGDGDDDSILPDDGDDENNVTNDTDEQAPDLSQWQDIEEFRLEAVADGWIGRDPDPIADQENPLLILFNGREYTITIVNGDGQEHDLRIEDATGDVIEDYESDSVEEEGAETSIDLEASDEMVLYYCSYHEQSMAGEIRTEEDRDFSDPEDDVVEEDGDGGRENVTDDAGNETDGED